MVDLVNFILLKVILGHCSGKVLKDSELGQRLRGWEEKINLKNIECEKIQTWLTNLNSRRIRSRTSLKTRFIWGNLREKVVVVNIMYRSTGDESDLHT